MNMSPILRRGADGSLFFWCPGCDSPHRVSTEGAHRWSYNGNPLKPTFQPSLLVTSGHFVAGRPQPPDCSRCNDAAKDGEKTHCSRCHSFIADGNIQFLADCTHGLAGQTLPIPAWPKPDYQGVEPVPLPEEKP